jgi:hypothetical protein
MKAISLKLRHAQILARARATLARCEEEDRQQRSMKFWAYKALHACRQAFERDETLNFRFMSDVGQKQARERRKVIEAELKRIAGYRR